MDLVQFYDTSSCQREQKTEFQTIKLIYKFLAYSIVNCTLHETVLHLNVSEPSGSFYLRRPNEVHGLHDSVISPLLKLTLNVD